MLFTAAGENTPKGTQTRRNSFVGKIAINNLMTSPYNVYELHEKVMYMADFKVFPWGMKLYSLAFMDTGLYCTLPANPFLRSASV